VTTTKKPATTSGIPTAKGYLPVGTPASVCIDHNRACKVARLVTAALTDHYDDHITDDELDLVADRAGVRRPGSDDTRDAVRAGLTPPFTDDDCNQDVAEAVRDAADRGRPFQYLLPDGRHVLLIALPLGEA
jgi:hypothetical protein